MITNVHNKEFLSVELRQLLESIGTLRTFQEGTYLFHQGMDAKEIYLIKSALVQVSLLSSEGEELMLRICKKDDIVGELTLFCDNPKFLLNTKVVETGEVFAINIESLQKELIINHTLSIEMMKWVSNHMRKFQSKIRDLLLNGKKGALYSTLIRLTNSYGIKRSDGILIDMPFTNQELAKFCGATREYVNRMLGELRKKDVLAIDSSGKILIKDLVYLKIKNNCENCTVEVCNMD
ncbi:Crp/Fnr family transcriptional regulator [Fervidibacillus albus]|uniref:Crp/Fnr family transcriptional regulator n=1 Tax=Fervidibacillus albus TaxID=2980026 RepID=A0A9E8LV24_9BACI|nr:Crp/Fnr family transcriptional regulator [Fervidibacillus albus]WAA09339.1 Crp/Fnr family transcriptional regulator [Fervidibacillus albus]